MNLHCRLVLGLGLVCVGEVGDVEAGAPALVESQVKYHSCLSGILTAISVNPDAGQCLLGSLAGAVSS